jgi:tRNA1Val (adenine37-N6)-methyltransferase
VRDPNASSDLGELTDDALTDRIRVLQRRAGHRYSVDDVVTAWVAVNLARNAATATYLDLGCGLGSVLLMVTDRIPGLQAIGLEAQAQSFELATANVQRNALCGRVRVLHGDLRDRQALERVRAENAGRGFDLITGTPPYKPAGSATPSPDPQRAYARVELRGGVEDYLRSAAQLLSPQGACVVCMESSAEARVRAGASQAGLAIREVLPVIPIAGRKGRLFSVYTLLHSNPHAAACELRAALVLRDARGARTAIAHELRACFGLSIDPAEPPSPALRRRGQRSLSQAAQEASGCEPAAAVGGERRTPAELRARRPVRS